MGLKAFGFGKNDRRRPEDPQLLGVKPQDRGALHIVEHAEAGGEARRAGGRQHMVGAADIVADDLGRMAANENRAGIADLGDHRFRVGKRQLEMLGGNAVGERYGLCKIGHEDDGAEIAPACPGDPAPLQRREPGIDGRGDGGGVTTGAAGGSGTGDCCGGGTARGGRTVVGSIGAVTTAVGLGGGATVVVNGFSGVVLGGGVTEVVTPFGATGALVSYRQAMVSASTISGMPISSDIVSITRPFGCLAAGSAASPSAAANCSVGASGSALCAAVGALSRSADAEVS